MKIPSLAIFCIILLSSTFSCGEYDILESNKKILRTVDSVYYAHKDSLRQLSDSLCEKNTAAYTQAAIDSIRPIRLAEIETLIEEN